MNDILLGKRVTVPDSYNPAILYAIPRKNHGDHIHGFDLWRSYELSWRGPKGKPEMAILELVYPVQSKYIVESKSLKLYLNGLSNESFSNSEEVRLTITRDLGKVLSAPWIDVSILEIQEGLSRKWDNFFPGTCIDNLDIDIPAQGDGPAILKASGKVCHEILTSHIMRTFCPITHQPDWADVFIEYHGKMIDHGMLLRYLCSYRNHEGFAEECCEQIFEDILSRCNPEDLKIGCFYTRRGGLDINPVRGTGDICPDDMKKYRLIRQ